MLQGPPSSDHLGCDLQDVLPRVHHAVRRHHAARSPRNFAQRFYPCRNSLPG